MKYDLYILIYFDGGHPKLFCLTPPLVHKNLLLYICQRKLFIYIYIYTHTHT